jgi:superfamily II DNA helicase RecQ
VQRDLTTEALAVVRLVRAVKQHGSLSHVVDVFRGANNKAVKDRSHNTLPEHGAGKAFRCSPRLPQLCCVFKLHVSTHIHLPSGFSLLVFSYFTTGHSGRAACRQQLN